MRRSKGIRPLQKSCTFISDSSSEDSTVGEGVGVVGEGVGVDVVFGVIGAGVDSDAANNDEPLLCNWIGQLQQRIFRDNPKNDKHAPTPSPTPAPTPSPTLSPTPFNSFS